MPKSLQTPPSPARKSTGTSYLLWLLCLIGFCGIHRVYNGRIITGQHLEEQAAE